MIEYLPNKVAFVSASAFQHLRNALVINSIVLSAWIVLSTWNAQPANALPSRSSPNKNSIMPCTVISGGNEILGGFKTYVTPKAVRIQSLSSKWYLITKAPDWHVTLYNPANNQGISMPLQRWLNHTPQFAYWPVPNEFEQWHIHLSTKIKFLGYPCLKNIVFKTTAAAKHAYRSKNSDYILLDNQIASVESCHVVQVFAGVPLSERLPLCFSMPIRCRERDDKTADKYSPHYILKSIKIEDSSMPSDFFAYPAGFKNVKREVDVISDSQKQQNFENIIGPLTEPTK